MTQILANIPLWVFPLLVLLVALGLRATRDRTAPVWVLYLMPLLGLLSLSRALSLGPVALAALLAGWGLGVLTGLWLQPRWTMARQGMRVTLRGESVTVCTVLGLFLVNFAAGMVQGMAPALAAGAEFGLGWGLLAGLLSGSLAGRALSIARTTQG
ncbi:hypothetical protein [Tropicibacter sp. S64]|uniref:hypothetical protein n=1 Tax=Tropicibacter sp. S64 TaxID=3415122 RepID=UPI003C7BEA5E